MSDLRNFPPEMPKRFLNVEYSGIKTDIDVTDAERISQVQDAVKVSFGPVMADVGAAQIQLQDQKGQQITDLEEIQEEYYKKLKNGGLFLAIRTLPLPIRESRNEGSTSF